MTTDPVPARIGDETCPICAATLGATDHCPCGEQFRRGIGTDGRSLDPVSSPVQREAVEAADLSRWTRRPHRLAVDAKGYVWRVFGGGMWSMAPVNADNSPIPRPVTFYEPVASSSEGEAVEPVADTEAVETVRAKYDRLRERGEPHDTAFYLATARRERAVVTAQVDGERPTLAELHARYLVAREHTLSTDGMDRDAAIEAQALYVLGEASELHAACKHGTGGWMAVWLLIIADNLMHLLINRWALRRWDR